MKIEIKVAAASTAATKHKPQKESYPKAALLSRAREQIGQLLFRLNGNDSSDGWQQLEINLRKFYEVQA